MSRTEYYLEPRYDSRNSFYKKARVIREDKKVSLISYSTKVCEIDYTKPVGKNVDIKGFYSQTTTRHIKDFLYQEGFKVGNQQFLWETYTEEGQKEALLREEKRIARELRKQEIEAEKVAKEERKIEREAKRAEKREAKINKLFEKISKELGDSFTEEEINALVLAEL